MYHPSEEGTFWTETHYPEVKIFRREGMVQINIFTKPHLKNLFELRYPENWSYQQHSVHDWSVYSFILKKGDDEQNIAEIKALNSLLTFCLITGSNEDSVTETSDTATAQLAFASADNPTEFQMGSCGVWATMSSLITDFLQHLLNPRALEEFVSSRMKGVWKILYPNNPLLLRDVDMHLYQGGNPLPIMRAAGQCACLSVTSNNLNCCGGFVLSPHNVDSHYNQFVLLTGALLVWQRTRTLIHRR